jgi:hypothetical protein
MVLEVNMEELYISRSELSELLGYKNKRYGLSKLHNRYKVELEYKFKIEKGKYLYNKEGITFICKKTSNKMNAYNLLKYIGYNHNQIIIELEDNNGYFDKQLEIEKINTGVKIILSDGTRTIVDKEHKHLFEKYDWFNNGRYVEAKFENKRMYLHRYLMGDKTDSLVDHKDGNGFNNQTSNLREASNIQNRRNSKPHKRNTLGYKGIITKPSGNYTAKITVNSKTITIGTFTNLIASVNAYNFFAKLVYGEFAFLNDIEYMEYEEFIKYSVKRWGDKYEKYNPLEQIQKAMDKPYL